MGNLVNKRDQYTHTHTHTQLYTPPRILERVTNRYFCVSLGRNISRDRRWPENVYVAQTFVRVSVQREPTAPRPPVAQ